MPLLNPIQLPAKPYAEDRHDDEHRLQLNLNQRRLGTTVIRSIALRGVVESQGFGSIDDLAVGRH